ncbi:MAG: galactokinase [Phaeodactylibacter sp.]|nr:galactokinase [Phaeodactylibacter sp.]
MLGLADILDLYEKRFDTPPLLVRACGHINIIGEHTDYNQGFVLPVAADKYIFFALAENGTSSCHFYAANTGESCSFHLKEIQPGSQAWANHLMGILQQFEKDGVVLEGIDCVFGGNLPAGAGMGFSAALECGFALGVNALFSLDYSLKGLAQLAQRASNEFVGLSCGAMGHFASMLGREGHAIRLDCRNFNHEYVPLELGDYELVLVDSRAKHSPGESEYLLRVAECHAGVAVLKQYYPTITSLRDVTLDMLKLHRSELEDSIYRRCIFVAKENARLQEACRCLWNGDIARLGTLLLATHEGLRDEFEVSCPEIGFLADFAASAPGVLGARLMGAGFGGYTLNLVHIPAKQQFLKAISGAYFQKFGIHPAYYMLHSVDGTMIVREA